MKARMRLTPLIIAAVLLFASVPGAAAQGTQISFQQARFSHPLRINNPYFPLVKGTRYEYRGTSDQASTYDVMIVTEDTKVVSGVTTRVVLDRAWEDGQLVEKTYDWYAQDDAGNVWYLGEDTAQIANGKVVGHEGSWKAGTNGAVAGIIMEAHPTIGDAYRQEYLVGVAEDRAQVISLHGIQCVPYDCFTNLLKTQETSRLEPGVVEYKWYARGIGEIKSKLAKGGTEVAYLTRIIRPSR